MHASMYMHSLMYVAFDRYSPYLTDPFQQSDGDNLQNWVLAIECIHPSIHVIAFLK